MEKFRDRPRKKFRVSLIANIKCTTLQWVRNDDEQNERIARETRLNDDGM